MSSTLRDATEHTVHAFTDLVGDAVQHIDLPHIDLARVVRRRRSLSPAVVVAIAASMVLAVVVAVRLRKGRSKTNPTGFREPVADRPPTKAEEAAAESIAKEIDVDRVAEEYEHMMELGAHVKGEGQIELATDRP